MAVSCRAVPVKCASRKRYKPCRITAVKIVVYDRVSLWIDVKTSQSSVPQKTFRRPFNPFQPFKRLKRLSHAFKRLSWFQMSFLDWVVRCSDVFRYCNSFLWVWKPPLFITGEMFIDFRRAFLVFEMVFTVCRNCLSVIPVLQRL